jgi:5,10-methylenetetrahydromethanopterin reductase
VYKGSIGLHIGMSILNRYRLPELLDAAGIAVKELGDFNFKRVWFNDNLEYRNVVVAATALVSRFDIDVGTAVAVPHVRNPIDLASAVATLTELRPGRKIGLGIGAGSASLTGQKIELTRKEDMVGELASFLRSLLDGNEVNVEEYPLISEYFHFKPNSFKLRFPIMSEVDLLYGYSGMGSKTTSMIAKFMDGVMVQTRLLKINEMQEMITRLTTERQKIGRKKEFRKILTVSASVSRNREAALEGGRRFAAQMIGSTPLSLLQKRGITSEDKQKLVYVFSKNEGLSAGAEITPDSLVKRVVLAGTPYEVLEEVSALFEFAEKFGFEEVMIGPPLGPDPVEVVDVWAKDILPSVL